MLRTPAATLGKLHAFTDSSDESLSEEQYEIEQTRQHIKRLRRSHQRDITPTNDTDDDKKEENTNSRDSSNEAFTNWNKSRDTTRSTDHDVHSILNNAEDIYCDYFVVKSSDSKVRIRLHGTNGISTTIGRILQSGPFGRNAFIAANIKNGYSQLNQLKNEKLKRIFYDEYDNDDTQQIGKHCCLIHINNVLVYNSSYADIVDILQHTKLETLQFQKPNRRPSRMVRVQQTYKLFSKVIRHKILFQKWFEYVILLSIIANTVCLAMVNPLKSGTSPIQEFIEKAEYAFFVIFLLEMILKMLGFGLYGKYYDPYLRKREETKQKNKKKLNKCKAQCAKRWRKCWGKLYTKCALKGWVGKDRQIQAKRDMTRSKSFTNQNGTREDIPGLWNISLSDAHRSESVLYRRHASSDTHQTHDENHFYFGYFPSGWNILDFVIVMSSFLAIFNLGNLTAIRIIRILRPLRTISRVRPLKLLINTVFSSLGELSNVLFLMLFLFVIFGIVGVQLFSGVLHQICFNRQETDDYMRIHGIQVGKYELLTEDDWYKGLHNSAYTIQYMEMYDYCQKVYTSEGCKAGNDAICLEIAPNANSEITSFDNIGFAILNEFIIITFDGWSSIMYMMQDGVSRYVWIYFFVVTFVCGFFVLQLNLAVLVTQYVRNSSELEKNDRRSKRARRKKEKKEKKEKKKKQKAKLAPQPTLINSPNKTKLRNSNAHNEDNGHKSASVSPFDAHALQRYNYGTDQKIEEEFGDFDMDFEDEEETVPCMPAIGSGCRSSFIIRCDNDTDVIKNNTDMDIVYMDDDTVIPTMMPLQSRPSRADSSDEDEKTTPLTDNLDNQTDSNNTTDNENGDLYQQSDTIRSSSAPTKPASHLCNINSNSNSSNTRYKKVYSESALSELSSTSCAFITHKTSSIRSTASSSTSPPFHKNNVVYSPPDPAPLSTKGRKKKKRVLKPYATMDVLPSKISSIRELHPIDDMDGWTKFKSKTFHASLKTEKWDDALQLCVEPENLARQASTSSFAEMIPSSSPPKQENSSRTPSGSPAPRSLYQSTNCLRFSIDVTPNDHHKLRESIIRQNYQFSKTAITNSIPKRNALYNGIDTSNRFVQAAYRICIHPWFDAILLVCIVTNTVIIALEWPYMPQYLEKKFELINTIFTLIFFAEMVLKLIGLGCKEYFGDNFNKFDFIIVVVSMFDLTISLRIGTSGNAFASSLSVFRSLRLLRLFRILRIFRVVNKIESLRILTATLSRAVADVSYLCLIPFLLVFMFATLGVSLFALDYANIDETKLSARHSFKNIKLAMITVFQVVTGDNWTGIMYSNAEITGKSYSFLFFLAIIIFGDFMLMNLFVAVLLTKINEASAKINDPDKWLIDALTEYAKGFYGTEMRYQEKLVSLCHAAEQLRFQEQLRRLENIWLPHYKKNLFREKWALIGKSLGMFSATNTIRCMLYAVVHSIWFEWFIAIMIIINCVMLAFDTPQMKRQHLHVVKLFEIVDIVFVCIYSLEMLFRVIADGFMAKPMFDDRKWEFINVYSGENGTLNQQWTTVCQDYIKDYVQIPESLDTECGKILNCIQCQTGYTVIHFMSAHTEIKHFRMIFYNQDDDETKRSLQNAYRIRKKRTATSTETRVVNYKLCAEVDAEDGDTETSEDSEGYDDFETSIADPSKPQLMYIYKLTNPLQGEWKLQTYDDDVLKIADHSFSPLIHSPQMCNLRQGAYLHDNWNILDALVVLISFISLLFPSSIGYFRVLRAIRPLRLAIRFESLRVAITSLIYSIPGVISTAAFILLFWTALAILGVNIMCATFMRCSITDAEVLQDIVTRRDCEHAGGEWMNVIFTFDDVFKSIQSIFIVALRVNWSQIMWNAVDSVGVDMQPKANNRLIFSLYFIMTILIAGFFTFNLLISVVVDNFQVIKNKYCGGSLFLTKQQKQWVQQRMITDRIDITKDYECNKQGKHYRVIKFVFDICQHTQFDLFIMICIILNTLQMCLEHYKQPETWTVVLVYLNIMFIGIFTIEAILKIIAYGFKQYWRYDHWNKFDFILVIVSLLDLLLASVLPLVIGGADIDKYRFGFNVLRILRVGRALRLIKKATTLRLMFLTLYYSLPSLLNVGSLIFILMFIYSIIGMNIFADVQHQEAINEFVNFTTFPNAMQTLYRIGTLDSWDTIYETCVRSAGTALVAAIFFLSYCIIGTLILINVFIAVILENFVQIRELEAQNKQLDCVRSWTKTWNKLDIFQEKYLTIESFLYSIVITPFPIGILSPSSIEGLHLYDKEYARSINNLNQRISDPRTSRTKRYELEKKRLRLSCKSFLHYSHHPQKLKKKFLKQLQEIKVNIIKSTPDADSIDCDDDPDLIWIVSFSDVLQALSAMIVGPKIKANVTHPDVEKPLVWWLQNHADYLCAESGIDISCVLSPKDDSELDVYDEEESNRKAPKELTCLNVPHNTSSQYEDFIQRTDKDITTASDI